MNVFAYGSLMFDPVWRAVVGRVNPSVPGRLARFAAFKISGQTFPGLATVPGGKVTGRVWLEVTEAELGELDRFESGIYQREQLTVDTAPGGPLPCWTYVVRPDCRSLLLPELWDCEEFERLHLATFIESESNG